MASLGSMTVNLIARTSRFNRALKKSSARVRAFGAKMMRLGGTVSAVGAAALGGAAKEALDFEKSMSRVQTMLDATAAKHLPRIGSAIEDMAVRFNRSTDRMSSAMFDLLSAQVPVGQALDMLKTGAITATAGFTEMDTAMSTTITLYQSFRDQLGGAMDAADVLFSTLERGRGTMSDFAENMGDFLPAASAVGAKLSEAAAAFATVTQATGNAAMSSTAVRNIFTSFRKTTPKMRAAFEKYFNAPMNTATLQSKGLVNILERLRDLPADVVTKIIPRRRALRGIDAILNNMGHFKDSVQAIQQRGGAAMRAFSKRAEDAGFSLGQAWEATKKAVRAIGEQLLPTLRRAAQWWTNWIEKNGELVLKLGKVVMWVTAAGAAMAAFGAGVWIIGALLTPIGAVLGGLVLLEGAFGAVSGAIRGIGNLLPDWATSWTSAVKTATEASLALQYVWQNARDVLTLAMNSAALSLVRFKNRAVWVFTEVIPSTLTWLGDQWWNILETWSSLFLNFWKNLASNVVSIFQNLPGLVRGSVSFGELWTPLTEGFRNSIQGMPDIAAREVGAVEKRLKDRVDKLGGKVGAGYANFLEQNMPDLGGEQSKLVEGAGKGMGQSAADLLNNRAGNIGQQIGQSAAQSATAGAIEAGSKKAFSRMVAPTFRQNQKPARQTARNTSRMHKTLQRMERKMGGQPVDIPG